MSRYCEFHKELTEKYNDKPEYSIYLWLKKRFQIECGKDYETYICEYCNKTEEFIDKFGSKGSSLQQLLEFIDGKKEELKENEINKYWKDNDEGKAFLRLLIDYRKMGSNDANIEKYANENAQHINGDDHLRFIYEIIQNADDCEYEECAKKEISVDLSNPNSIIFQYDEKGMTYKDIISITTIGESNKSKSKKRLIGEKGIGFKTIFAACTEVEIHSGGYHFKLNGKTFAPEIIESGEETKGTKLILKLKNKFNESNSNEGNKLYKEIKDRYGVSSDLEDKNSAFQNCPVLFTNTINKITIKNNENNYFEIEKSENEDSIKYKIVEDCKVEKTENIEYFRVQKYVAFTYEEYNSRYKGRYTEEEYETLFNEKDLTISYPITIIAAKDILNISDGKLFSYLPTGTVIKAPINIDMPLKLNLNRSSMWFEDDQDTTQDSEHNESDIKNYTLIWNDRLMREMFFGEKPLINSFYEELKKHEDINIMNYIPNFDETKFLFDSEAKYADSIEKLNKYTENIFSVFKQIPYFKISMKEVYCTAEKAIMFDQFIEHNFYKEYYQQLPEGERQDKFLVEFNKEAINKAKYFGFKLFDVKGDGKKIEYLNNVLKGKEGPVLEECKKDEKERSKYLSSDISELNIFPAKNTNGTVRYTKYNNNFWFKAESDFGSDGRICFLDEELGNDGLLEDIEFMSSENINVVWEGLWEKIKQIKCAKDLFIELIELISKHVKIQNMNDWYSYTKAVLEQNDNKNSEFWDETRTENLITLINYNVGEFVEEEKDE